MKKKKDEKVNSEAGEYDILRHSKREGEQSVEK